VATVELRSVLAQSVTPHQVTTFRATGYDQEQNLRYGPATKEKAALVEWNEVPVEVSDFVIEYLDANDQVVGLAQVTVELVAGQTFVVDNPTILGVSSSLQSLTISPATRAIAKGTSATFTATGHFSDGTTQNLTSAAGWACSDYTVASISGGQSEGLAVGDCAITASFAGLSAQATLTVSDATLVSLAVSPNSPAIASGTSLAFTVEGFFSDGSFQDVTDDIAWSSSDTDVAGMENGLVHGLQPGQTTITATLQDKSDQAVLTVTPAVLESLTVEGGASSIAQGTTTTLTAIGHFSDDTTQDLSSAAVWSAEPATAVEVDKGRVTALQAGPGPVTISATFAGLSGPIKLVVTDAVATAVRVETVTEDAPTVIGLNETITLKAVATFSDQTEQDVTQGAEWSASGEGIASVDSGLVTATGLGQSDISATFRGHSDELRVTVRKPALPQLRLASGAYTFDTDTGKLLPQIGDSETAPGWNNTEKRLVLQSFTVDGTATLNVTGTLALKVKAESDVTVSGMIDFPAQDGTDGVPGSDGTNGTDGSTGHSGGDVNLFSSGDLTVTGTIKANGGKGGNGGGYSSDKNTDTVSAGAGGRGGDSGQIILSAGDNLGTGSAQLLMVGGEGGNGGDVNIKGANYLGHVTAGAGGGGGDGGSQGGKGGNGGDVISYDNLDIATAGAGGDGGNGGLKGGNGGHGGKVALGSDNSAFILDVATATAGGGGHGGNGDSEAGSGGDGGDVNIAGDNFSRGQVTATAGAGGDGGNGGAKGGNGGNGGLVDIAGTNEAYDLDISTATATAGAGGGGGDGEYEGGGGGNGGDVTIAGVNYGRGQAIVTAGAGGGGGSGGSQGGNGGDGGNLAMAGNFAPGGQAIAAAGNGGEGGSGGSQGGNGGNGGDVISYDNSAFLADATASITAGAGGNGGSGESQGGNGGNGGNVTLTVDNVARLSGAIATVTGGSGGNGGNGNSQGGDGGNGGNVAMHGSLLVPDSTAAGIAGAGGNGGSPGGTSFGGYGGTATASDTSGGGTLISGANGTPTPP
jgi:hypothetical protein